MLHGRSASPRTNDLQAADMHLTTCSKALQTFGPMKPVRTILKRSAVFTALSLLLPCLLLGFQAGCSTRPSMAPALRPLQGTWKGAVVSEKSDDRYTLTITGNSFHFHRDADFWFETTIELPEGTEPKQLHATIHRCAPGQENSIGKVVVAIFKIEDGKLTLAARGDGGDETPKAFEVPDDKGLTRYELRRVEGH